MSTVCPFSAFISREDSSVEKDLFFRRAIGGHSLFDSMKKETLPISIVLFHIPCGARVSQLTASCLLEDVWLLCLPQILGFRILRV
jgi:hypothetical protein